MEDLTIKDKPKILSEIQRKSDEISFKMPSDLHVGALLKTLITSKPKGSFLELGTGIGLSLCWMIDGMDKDSKLITVDNDPELIAIANQYFGCDKRVKIVCMDGTKWIRKNQNERFDLIFADAWPGKYSAIEEILEMVKVGGFYVIDDMAVQPNWPEGHQEHVDELVDYFKRREDFNMAKINWSTGLIIAVRKL